MAHTFYHGKCPENMNKLYNNPSLGSINDFDTGITVFWYRGYLRLRNPDATWVSLYLSSNYGRRDGFWCVLQPSNEFFYSSIFLEIFLMGDLLYTQAINEDIARTIGNGIFIPEVLAVVELPEKEKTKKVMAKQRIQQSKWACAIKALANFRCQATGSQYGLQAAHIKPFSECNDEEAWSLDNGICLTASVHTIYDSGEYKNLDENDPLTSVINVEILKKSRE